MLERAFQVSSCEASCSDGDVDGELGWLRWLWDTFMVAVVVYFLCTLVDAVVQHRLMSMDEISLKSFANKMKGGFIVVTIVNHYQEMKLFKKNFVCRSLFVSFVF